MSFKSNPLFTFARSLLLYLWSLHLSHPFPMPSPPTPYFQPSLARDLTWALWDGASGYSIIRSKGDDNNGDFEVDWDRVAAWSIIITLLIPCETSGWAFKTGSDEVLAGTATVPSFWVHALLRPIDIINKLFEGTLALRSTLQSPNEHNLEACRDLILLLVVWLHATLWLATCFLSRKNSAASRQLPV